MNFRIAVTAALFACVLTLTSCAAAPGSTMQSDTGHGPEIGIDVLSADGFSGFDSGGAQLPFEQRSADMAAPFVEETDGAQSGVTESGRSIVQTGSIDLEVTSLDAGVQSVTEIAKKLDGSVVSQNISQYGGSARSGYLSVNVPAARFDEAFTELAKLGSVRSEHRSADDVTAQHVDLKARVAALETSVERLNNLLANAASTSDLLDIENMLSERQANLDGLQAQLKALEGQVAESNVLVSLTEPTVLPGGGPQTFGEALRTGITSIGSFIASAIIVLGVTLPWLGLLAVAATIVIIPLRMRRKRRGLITQPTDSVADQPVD